MREIKNEVSIRHIFFRTLRFCHTSRSLLVSSLVCQDTLFLSLIYFLHQMLVCSFWGGRSGLDFFGLVLMTSTALHNAVPKEITVTYRDPWMGPKLIAMDLRKRSRESMGTLGGNYICFRKSFSQTFNLIRLDFPSVSPRFPFFVVSLPHNRQLGTHTNGLKGSLEAPDSKTLPQWILNLRVYAHTCRQTKEI